VSSKQPIWKRRKPPHEVGQNDLSYSSLKSDVDGWVDASIFRPFPYDMVTLKTEDKTMSGWWTGNSWDGLKMKVEDKILYWKCNGTTHTYCRRR